MAYYSYYCPPTPPTATLSNRWKKPTREQLATREYIAEYRRQKLSGGCEVKVFRGLDEDNTAEVIFLIWTCFLH